MSTSSLFSLPTVLHAACPSRAAMLISPWIYRWLTPRATPTILMFRSVPSVRKTALPSGSIAVTVYFTNPVLREAISYLVDWQACNDVLTGGIGDTEPRQLRLDESVFIMINMTGASTSKKAKRLWLRPDTRTALILKSRLSQQTGYQNVAVLIQSYLAEVGINVTVRPIDYAAWFDVINAADFESYVGTSAGPLMFATAYYDDAVTRIFNYGGPQISDPTLTEWVNIARTTFDYDERLDALTNIQKYAIDNSVCYGICDINNYALYSVNLTDISASNGSLRPLFCHTCVLIYVKLEIALPLGSVIC